MKEYHVITEGQPNEIWAAGFYGDEGRDKAARQIAEGYWHRYMYAHDKHKTLVVVETVKAAPKRAKYNLSTMARPAFEKLGDRLNRERGDAIDAMIAAGFGQLRGSDVREALKQGKLYGAPLSDSDVALFQRSASTADAMVDWVSERDHRMKMHGSLRPWKARPQ